MSPGQNPFWYYRAALTPLYITAVVRFSVHTSTVGFRMTKKRANMFRFLRLCGD